MTTREQNRNNKRREIERFDWFVERIQTCVAFGWLSERSGEKNFLGHFHISHNTLCWRVFCPQHTQTVLHTHCLHLVLGLSIVPREM